MVKSLFLLQCAASPLRRPLMTYGLRRCPPSCTAASHIRSAPREPATGFFQWYAGLVNASHQLAGHVGRDGHPATAHIMACPDMLEVIAPKKMQVTCIPTVAERFHSKTTEALHKQKNCVRHSHPAFKFLGRSSRQTS
ncbi:hypothetical protein BOTBODRAFT_447893 [Botryobasidium botryosum FD-172 SS1]|uniref:Uncharacterized protein n=1 Tax=Botryobasidium botryosum (strain FD-172 SS1) TaxID=930990 RepID=A0A067M7V7_BOTB1|nr:hypothetical protein BOTBODRAFT_447893 [Botryobasidium botryosum FD-172 SS1]